MQTLLKLLQCQVGGFYGISLHIIQLRLPEQERAIKVNHDIDLIVHYVYKVRVSVLELQSKHSITN